MNCCLPSNSLLNSHRQVGFINKNVKLVRHDKLSKTVGKVTEFKKIFTLFSANDFEIGLSYLKRHYFKC